MRTGSTSVRFMPLRENTHDPNEGIHAPPSFRVGIRPRPSPVQKIESRCSSATTLAAKPCNGFFPRKSSPALPFRIGFENEAKVVPTFFSE